MKHKTATKMTAMFLSAMLVCSLFSNIPASAVVLAAGTNDYEQEAEKTQSVNEETTLVDEKIETNLETEPVRTLSGIEVTKKTKDYVIGDEVKWDAEELTVTAVYSDATKEPISLDSADLKIEGKEAVDTTKAGTYTVTFKYKEKEQSILITVRKLADLKELKVEKTKTEYLLNEDVKWDDLKVTAVYDDGKDDTNKEMTGRYDENNKFVSDFVVEEDKIDYTKTEEIQKIPVTYTEKINGENQKVTAEVELLIHDVLTSISAKKTKKDDYIVKDKLELTDFEVTAVYNEGVIKSAEQTDKDLYKKTKIIEPIKEDDEKSVGYKSNASEVKMAPSGTKKLEISYTENGVTKTATISFKVKVPDVPVINGVRTANVLDFGADPTDLLSDKAAIQDALDVSTEDGVPLVVYLPYVPGGIYYIGNVLYIHSNTTIRMDANATIKRNSTLKAGDGREGVNHNMLATASSGTTTSKVGKYDNAKNITIEGGIWDGGEIKKATSSSNVLNIGHAENVVIRNATIKNCYGSHLIEFAGVKNAEVYNCYFTGFRKESVKSEAIQLDICYSSEWNQRYLSDNTFCDTINVHDNQFVDYPVALGNHHTVSGKHNKNVTFTNNTVTNTVGTGFQGVYLYGCDNSVVSNNTISGFENGIKPYLSTGYTVQNNTISNCDFGIVSAGASTGSIYNNNISDTNYQGILVYDTSKVAAITGNTIKNVGLKKKRDGIGVNGGVSSVDVISDNVIDSTGRYGVYIYSAAKAPTITGNTISNTVDSGIYVSDANAKASIKSNKLKNVGKNAIKIASKKYVKQSYTFAPKVVKLDIKNGYMDIKTSNLKKVQLKFNSKSYSKSTKKKKYRLNFKKYKKKVKSTSVIFTDKNKNVVTTVLK